jgi:glutathione S-transferase
MPESVVDLYFAPLACSLATRIALYESAQDARFHQVMLATKRTADGQDYLAVNPKGQVPALRTPEGGFLTEGAAILQFVADRAPGSGLAPAAGSFERYQLQQWLSYIGSEVHKQVFYTIFNPASPAEARAHARDVALPTKYDYLSKHLADRAFLVGDQFTVADAYLVTTLNWAAPAGVDLSRWPVLAAYHARQCQRPAVARAIGEEMALRNAA